MIRQLHSNVFAALVALAFLLAGASAGTAQDAGQSIDLTGIGHDRGMDSAPITIIEFADFACSACGLFARESMPILEKNHVETGRVRVKYVPFILGTFPRAMDAALAGSCAAEQNAFWPMHDVLYRRQREWTGARDAKTRFQSYAGQLGLNPVAFAQCMREERGRADIERNSEIARALQIRGTPTFFINGGRITGAIPAGSIDELIAAVEAQLGR